jgi:hypothetical protein
MPNALCLVDWGWVPVASCHNCVTNGDERIYEQPRRDRLREYVQSDCTLALHTTNIYSALIKSEMLINLLKEIRLSSDGEIATQIVDIFQQFEHRTPPTTPSRSIKSMQKLPRASSDDTEHDIQFCKFVHLLRLKLSLIAIQCLRFFANEPWQQRYPSPHHFLGTWIACQPDNAHEAAKQPKITSYVTLLCGWNIG